MDGKKKIKLSDIPRKEVFQTPEGYFDSLAGRIGEKLRVEKGKQVYLPVVPWNRAIAAAAAVILLAVITLPFVVSRTSSPSAEQLVAQISPEDCMLYLQHADMDAAEILSLIDSQDLFGEQETSLPQPEIGDEDLDILYEKYGVTDDEKLQTL